MSQVIILNGPPGCGKDTIGRQFAYDRGYDPVSFKYPLFKIAASTLNMGFDEFVSCYEDREWKETPRDDLNGHTIRELLIQISETYIKPFFGQDFFGQAALRMLRDRPWQNHFVFTDGGFPAEIDLFAQAGHEVVLVHMYRDGCTFEGDSRNYVLSNTIPRIYTLNNNGTVQEALDALEGILNEHNDRTNPPNLDERELVSGDSEPIPNMARPVRARQRVNPIRYAEAYGAGGTFGGGSEAPRQESVPDFSTVEARATASEAIQQIVERAEARQRQAEATRQARQAAAEPVRADSDTRTSSEPVSWTARMARTPIWANVEPASASTVVDEAEIMLEGQF